MEGNTLKIYEQNLTQNICNIYTYDTRCYLVLKLEYTEII